MNVNPERKYLAVSIKHSLPGTGRACVMSKPLVLWGERTPDDAPSRSFGGYTCKPEKAELYTQKEWADYVGKDVDWLSVDVFKVNSRLLRECKKFDSVLVEYEDYMNYYCFVYDPERS